MASVIKEQKVRTSRVGKKPIPVPAGVSVTIDGQHVAFKGAKGAAALQVHPWVTVQREGDELKVAREVINSGVLRRC